MLVLRLFRTSCEVVPLMARHLAEVRLALTRNEPLVACTEVVVLPVLCQFIVLVVLNLNLGLDQIIANILRLFESGLLNQFLLTMLFKAVGVAASKSLICRGDSSKRCLTPKVLFTVEMAISRDRLVLARRLLRGHLVSLLLNIMRIQILV